jgi:hypothetical protein
LPRSSRRNTRAVPRAPRRANIEPRASSVIDLSVIYSCKKFNTESGVLRQKRSRGRRRAEFAIEIAMNEDFPIISSKIAYSCIFDSRCLRSAKFGCPRKSLSILQDNQFPSERFTFRETILQPVCKNELKTRSKIRLNSIRPNRWGILSSVLKSLQSRWFFISQ